MSAAENGACFFASRDAVLLTLPNSVAVDIHNEKYRSSKTWIDIALSHTVSGAVHVQSCRGLEKRLRSLCSSAECAYRKSKGRAKRQFLRKMRTLVFPLDPPPEVRQDTATEFMKKELTGAKEENKKLKESVQQLESVVRDLREQCSTLQRKVGVLMQLLHYKA